MSTITRGDLLPFTSALMVAILILFSSCTHENEEKIPGEWVCHVTDGDIKTIHYFEFSKGKKRNQFVEKVIPVSYNTIGLEVRGTWRIDFAGDLYLKYNLESLTDLTYGYAADFEVSTYLAARKLEMAIMNREDGYYELTFSGDDIMTIHSATDNETFHRKFSSSNSKSSSKRSTKSKTIESSSNDYTDANTVSTSSGSEMVRMTGKVGGKYPIEMELDLSDWDNVTGRYRYTSSGSGAWLTLKGNLSEGYLKMTEYNTNGEQCGSWNGDCYKPDGEKLIFSGTMTNSAGKTFNVELSE
ncbi:MAG: hypothetical protein K2I18_05610 [Paramuribaculum sp.]|nr:hypothetical protein [Paramuribaculum sp.]